MIGPQGSAQPRLSALSLTPAAVVGRSLDPIVARQSLPAPAATERDRTRHAGDLDIKGSQGHAPHFGQRSNNLSESIGMLGSRLPTHRCNSDSGNYVPEVCRRIGRRPSNTGFFCGALVGQMGQAAVFSRQVDR